ncbi:MAG TPA: 50S ribosomal protein L18 [Candidatus Nanoarchaeia archaeon]|nr:50S ribosomal protein L18 [Candidatus Nanoarchaeia archaeon]
MKKIPFARRRKQLTDYKSRLALVISGKHRLVVRLSNKYVKCQLIKYTSDGDLTVAEFNSRDLSKYGFNGTKNLQSGYLAGMVLGLKGLKIGIKEAVLDIGLRHSVKNSRIYACLKGAVESGLKVPHGEEVLPSDELLKKDELKAVITKIKGDNK